MVELMRECHRLVSLFDWLARCERAGVPCVPAVWSEAFPVGEMYRACEIIESHDTLLVEHAPGLIGAFNWLEGQREEAAREERRMMARWDCCSSAQMKVHMGKGGGWHMGMMELTLDDPRLWDCMAGEMLRIGARPWVEALRVDGYPVEFRVFYGPQGWQGASSYYPQRALPRDHINDMLMRACVNLADRFYEGVRFPFGFTADFLATEDFEVLFLEGGPPHVKGCPMSAHPCCFAEGEVRGVKFGV